MSVPALAVRKGCLAGGSDGRRQRRTVHHRTPPSRARETYRARRVGPRSGIAGAEGAPASGFRDGRRLRTDAAAADAAEPPEAVAGAPAREQDIVQRKTAGGLAARLADLPPGDEALNSRHNPEAGEDEQQRRQQLQAQASGTAQEVGYGSKGWTMSGQGHGRSHLPMRQAVRSELASEGAMLGAPGAGGTGGGWGTR